MHSAIVMMDNALINVYQDAISKNSIIQAQLPHRLSINSVNELVQAIEGIFLSQSPDAIAHRQSLFHKLTQNENEDTSALMNRIMLYLRMFEYTLPPKKATYWSFPYFLREKPYKIQARSMLSYELILSNIFIEMSFIVFCG